ncbi:GNAT family N-acetyltransferase [Arenibacter palladensis]|uniref:GNAT family N-acetyltransferase n=1 Tax=Arenibacter palladensis TaxID=237373 RepID=UPI002FD1614C
MLKQTINFFNQIFEIENGLPTIFSDIFFEKENRSLYEGEVNTSENKDGSLHKLYKLEFVPDYMVPKLKHPSLFDVKKVRHVKGYAAHLTDFTDVDSYLKNQFRSNTKTIRRYINRLETCFNIRYKLYYGTIDRPEYEFIMNSLEKMKENRFDQRDDQDESLAYWDYIYKIAFDLINKKRASLFVIYDEQKPIEISLNYHFNGILYSSNSSYDIDYSKFGLGHVEIYKQIEWCIANNYTVFEMGRGDLDYKRRWSNLIYHYEYHLVYQKKHIGAKLYTAILENQLQFKEFLKSKNVDTYLRRIKSTIKNNNKNDNGLEPRIKIEKITESSVHHTKTPIDCQSESFSLLKKILYDFAYSNIEHISGIKVFEIEKDKCYLIKGQRQIQKITVISKEEY